MDDRAYRVPPKWTEEAAQFVWETWRAAVAGEPCMQTGIWGEWGETGLLPEVCDALKLLAGLGFLCRVSVENEPGADYYWASEAARLRAWAAVGAPVLAPAEDGRPTPLWQMVRAASESKFGEPTDTDPTLATVKFGWRSERVWVRVMNGIAIVTHGHNVTGPVVAECTTPDALRAALDALAEEVSRG